MKNYIKVAAALAFTFGLAGCDLDPVVTDNVTQERHDELIGNPETQPKVAKAALAKVYSIFQDFYNGCLKQLPAVLLRAKHGTIFQRNIF